MMFELSLDIGEQARCADAEKVVAAINKRKGQVSLMDRVAA